MTTPDLPMDYLPGWMTTAEADELLASLTATIPWEQQTITMYGKEHQVPRLTAWFGDTAYRYSGTLNQAHLWTVELDELRHRLEAATGAQYNSCLANLYRDGQDTVGWHSDDEPELGPSPTIASVSLGSPRTFKLRHEATRQVTDIDLRHGDLLVMRDGSQTDYRHSVPRRARVTEPRINLTFRLFDAAG